MFRLGKTTPTPLPAETAVLAADPVNPKIEINDEQFTVMPEEYLSKAEASASRGGKKIYFVMAGAAAFLLLLSGGLYYFLFAQSAAPEVVVILPPVADAPAAPNEIATTTPEILKTIESQAFDPAGALLGSLKIILPAVVANKYGEALGVAILSAADISLPTGSVVAGGIYSPYPVGASFAEPVQVDLAAVNLSTPEARQNYYPAYLSGTAWQEISGASATPAGWAFNFAKFPAGPISLVERVATSTASATPGVLGALKPVPSLDTDTDGLTDEEEALLGTNRELADTDSDTYSDRAEIFNGYSPLTVDGKLADTDLFATYTNPTYGYKAPYPKKWLADSLDQTNKQVLFISATEEFLEILVEENPNKMPIVDWYRAQSPALSDVELDVSIIDGASAVWSPDGLTVYAGRDGLVFIITYNKGTIEQINWPTLFEYFYKNFKFGNTATQSATPPADSPALPAGITAPPPGTTIAP